MVKVKFNAENTAIDTKHSKSADKIVETLKDGNKVLDYGCGTGRNIRYIIENTNNVITDGTDIVEQL